MPSDVAVIVGAGESPYGRVPDPDTTVESVLGDAFVRALASAGIDRNEVDGLAVCSFTLGPDHAVDLAWRLGVRLRWIMEDTNGGAGGLNMLQHACRAIEAGDASVIVILAGDVFVGEAFTRLAENYNSATRDHLSSLPIKGPNALFALLTQQHMAAHGLEPVDYGHIPLLQRRWAAKNPGAVYRTPLTMEAYLNAPVVAEPLRRYDCVPVVSGADAIVVTSARRGSRPRSIRIVSLKGRYNDDDQNGNGLRTGLADLAQELWQEAGFGPSDVDLACLYDDYPVVVLIQLADLGFIEDKNVKRFIHSHLHEQHPDWPLNTSGGQLSAGQAGAGGGLHGLVEAVTQLRSEAGSRQIRHARRAVVTGYGMILYRYGGCANVAVLERQ